MHVRSQFLNGYYFSLWNMYTVTYGGMLLWGTSLPKFIDMISVFCAAEGPICTEPPHSPPPCCLYVKTPFGLLSNPPATILLSPLSNLNCKSPFTTGNSSMEVMRSYERYKQPYMVACSYAPHIHPLDTNDFHCLILDRKRRPFGSLHVFVPLETCPA